MKKDDTVNFLKEKINNKSKTTFSEKWFRENDFQLL